MTTIIETTIPSVPNDTLGLERAFCVTKFHEYDNFVEFLTEMSEERKSELLAVCVFAAPDNTEKKTARKTMSPKLNEIGRKIQKTLNLEEANYRRDLAAA